MTLDEMRSLYEKNSLTSTLGIEFTAAFDDGIEAKVAVREMHSRPGGIANGGLALALIETLGSVSACLRIDFEKKNALGISVDASHIGIARIGDTLTGRSKPIHVGKRTHIWEVVIHNQNKKLVSSGRVTLLIVDR